MDAQHFNKIEHYLIIVELLVEECEVHKELKEVNQVEQDLQNQRVTSFFGCRLEEGNAGPKYNLVEFGSLEECVVVYLFYYQQDHLHEVVKAKVFICFLVGLNNELEDIF